MPTPTMPPNPTVSFEIDIDETAFLLCALGEWKRFNPQVVPEIYAKVQRLYVRLMKANLELNRNVNT